MNNTNQFGLPDEPPEGTELIDNEKFSRKAVTARISPEDIENVLNKLDFFDKTITPTKTFKSEEEKQNYITSITLEDIAKRINPDLIEGRRYAEPVTEEERKLAKAAGTSAISNINVLKDLAWAKQSNAKEYLYAATKGFGITLATIVDNTVGTAAGLVNSIGSDEPLLDFVNNPVSAVIQDFEAELENVLPTYYPSDWEQRNTGQKVFTSNFWADNVLKNLGFAIGTYLSGAGAGALISKGLKARTRRIIGRKLGESFGEKLAKGELDDLARIITTDASKTNLALSGLEIDKIIKTASTLERTNRLITGVSSTLLGIQGEARIEALNARDQIIDKLSNAVDEKGNKLFGDDEVVKYANSLMNSIYIMNLAILAPTEFLQFGSHFLGSYKISNSIKHSIEGDILKGFALKKTPKFLRPINPAVKLVQKGTFEGSQEYLQFIAENTGYSVVDDIIDNPKAFKHVSNLYSSFIESIPEGIDRATNSEGAINFLSGFVLGTLGIPTFQKGNFISGGIYEVLKTDKYNKKQAKEIVDYLNKNIDILRSYANFNIAGSALQLAKEAALKDNDVFKHENAESELIFQLLSTLNDVGRLDDFVSQSKAFTNIDLSKPEGQNLINEIKELSIIKDESGNVTSNAFESFSDQEIADIVVKRNKKLIERAKYVKELSNRVKDLMPGQDIHTQSKFIHYNYMLKEIDTRLKDMKLEIDTKLKAINADINISVSDKDIIDREKFLRPILETIYSKDKIKLDPEVFKNLHSIITDLKSKSIDTDFQNTVSTLEQTVTNLENNLKQFLNDYESIDIKEEPGNEFKKSKIITEFLNKSIETIKEINSELMTISDILNSDRLEEEKFIAEKKKLDEELHKSILKTTNKDNIHLYALMEQVNKSYVDKVFKFIKESGDLRLLPDLEKVRDLANDYSKLSRRRIAIARGVTMILKELDSKKGSTIKNIIDKAYTHTNKVLFKSKMNRLSAQPYLYRKEEGTDNKYRLVELINLTENEDESYTINYRNIKIDEKTNLSLKTDIVKQENINDWFSEIELLDINLPKDKGPKVVENPTEPGTKVEEKPGTKAEEKPTEEKLTEEKPAENIPTTKAEEELTTKAEEKPSEKTMSEENNVSSIYKDTIDTFKFVKGESPSTSGVFTAEKPDKAFVIFENPEDQHVHIGAVGRLLKVTPKERSPYYILGLDDGRAFYVINSQQEDRTKWMLSPNNILKLSNFEGTWEDETNYTMIPFNGNMYKTSNSKGIIYIDNLALVEKLKEAQAEENIEDIPEDIDFIDEENMRSNIDMFNKEVKLSDQEELETPKEIEGIEEKQEQEHTEENVVIFNTTEIQDLDEEKAESLNIAPASIVYYNKGKHKKVIENFDLDINEQKDNFDKLIKILGKLTKLDENSLIGLIAKHTLYINNKIAFVFNTTDKLNIDFDKIKLFNKIISFKEYSKLSEAEKTFLNGFSTTIPGTNYKAIVFSSPALKESKGYRLIRKATKLENIYGGNYVVIDVDKNDPKLKIRKNVAEYEGYKWKIKQLKYSYNPAIKFMGYELRLNKIYPNVIVKAKLVKDVDYIEKYNEDGVSEYYMPTQEIIPFNKTQYRHTFVVNPAANLKIISSMDTYYVALYKMGNFKTFIKIPKKVYIREIKTNGDLSNKAFQLNHNDRSNYLILTDLEGNGVPFSKVYDNIETNLDEESDSDDMKIRSDLIHHDPKELPSEAVYFSHTPKVENSFSKTISPIIISREELEELDRVAQKRESLKVTPKQPTPKTEPSYEDKVADIERRRQEELDNLAAGSLGVVASDYLLSGGVGSILSSDYFIQGLLGSFTNASNKISAIRQKYANEVISKYGNLNSFIGTKLYNSMMQEIRDAIQASYNTAEALQIFDTILQTPAGVPVKLGTQLSIQLDAINNTSEQINSKYDAELEALNKEKTEDDTVDVITNSNTYDSNTGDNPPTVDDSNDEDLNLVQKDFITQEKYDKALKTFNILNLLDENAESSVLDAQVENMFTINNVSANILLNQLKASKYKLRILKAKDFYPKPVLEYLDRKLKASGSEITIDDALIGVLYNPAKKSYAYLKEDNTVGFTQNLENFSNEDANGGIFTHFSLATAEHYTTSGILRYKLPDPRYINPSKFESMFKEVFDFVASKEDLSKLLMVYNNLYEDILKLRAKLSQEFENSKIELMKKYSNKKDKEFINGLEKNIKEKDPDLEANKIYQNILNKTRKRFYREKYNDYFSNSSLYKEYEKLFTETIGEVYRSSYKKTFINPIKSKLDKLSLSSPLMISIKNKSIGKANKSIDLVRLNEFTDITSSIKIASKHSYIVEGMPYITYNETDVPIVMDRLDSSDAQIVIKLLEALLNNSVVYSNGKLALRKDLVLEDGSSVDLIQAIKNIVGFSVANIKRDKGSEFENMLVNLESRIGLIQRVLSTSNLDKKDELSLNNELNNLFDRLESLYKDPNNLLNKNPKYHFFLRLLSKDGIPKIHLFGKMYDFYIIKDNDIILNPELVEALSRDLVGNDVTPGFYHNVNKSVLDKKTKIAKLENDKLTFIDVNYNDYISSRAKITNLNYKGFPLFLNQYISYDTDIEEKETLDELPTGYGFLEAFTGNNETSINEVINLALQEFYKIALNSGKYPNISKAEILTRYFMNKPLDDVMSKAFDILDQNLKSGNLDKSVKLIQDLLNTTSTKSADNEVNKIRNLLYNTLNSILESYKNEKTSLNEYVEKYSEFIKEKYPSLTTGLSEEDKKLIEQEEETKVLVKHYNDFLNSSLEHSLWLISFLDRMANSPEIKLDTESSILLSNIMDSLDTVKLSVINSINEAYSPVTGGFLLDSLFENTDIINTLPILLEKLIQDHHEGEEFSLIKSYNSPISNDEKKATIKKRFGNSVKLVIVDSLLNGKASGATIGNVIQLVENASKAVLDHESFEVAFKLLTEDERRDILNEAKNNPILKEKLREFKENGTYDQYKQIYGEDEDRIIKETLAEEFVDYVKSSGTKTYKNNPYKNWFFKLIWEFFNWIKSLLNKSYTIDQLFYDIENGNFKDRVFSDIDSTINYKLEQKYDIYFNPRIINKIFSSLDVLLGNYLSNNDFDINKDLVEKMFKDFRENKIKLPLIIKDEFSANLYKDLEENEELRYEIISQYRNKLVRSKLLEEVETLDSIVDDIEEDQLSNDSLSLYGDDRNLKFNIHKHTSGNVRTLLLGIPKEDINELGLREAYPITEVIHKLSNILNGITSYDEALIIMKKNLNDNVIRSVLGRLYSLDSNKITKALDLLSKRTSFVQAFSKVPVNYVSLLLSKEGNTVINNSLINLENQVLIKLRNDYISRELKNKKLILRDISGKDISKKQDVQELFESNPKLANAVYEALGLNIINESEITYTDEEGNPCAKMGVRSSNFTKGSKWEIVKDLKGYPSHAQGGVDIKLGKDGFSFKGKNGYIKAAHGLVLPNNFDNPIEFEAMSKVLSQRNKHLNWVDRGLNPDKYPKIDNQDGTFSTHRLAYSTGDNGEAYVYPTIIQNDKGELEQLDDKAAWEYAKKTKTAMRVPNVKLAEYYSKNGLIKHSEKESAK